MSKKKYRYNDEGKRVPDKCPKCGADISVFLSGEPVYKCEKCKKYFGTVIFKESVDILLHEFEVGNMLPQVTTYDNFCRKGALDEQELGPIEMIDEIEEYNDYKTEGSKFKRSSLDSDQFGIPELRKYPIHDKKHVILAIKMFNHVHPKYEEELAENIKKRVKNYDIDLSFVGDKNRFKKYMVNE